MNPVLGKSVHGGHEVGIDFPRLLETRLLIQSNSGGGKSHTIRRIIEQVGKKVQWVILDPEGEFSTLREKYDCVICAVTGGDALAHPSKQDLAFAVSMECKGGTFNTYLSDLRKNGLLHDHKGHLIASELILKEDV